MIKCSCVVVHGLSEAAARRWHSVFPPPRSCEEHLQHWDDAGYGPVEAAEVSHKQPLITEQELQAQVALNSPLPLPPRGRS